MKKKSIIGLLVLLLMVSAFVIGCTPKESKLDSTIVTNGINKPKVKSSEEPTGEIKIGNVMELTGDWTPYWTNNSANTDIYNFITGMDTVSMTPDGIYQINETIVEKSDIKENKDASKTYTFTIKDGLKFSDGSDVTAKEYVTTVMLWSSKTIQDAGAKSDYGYYLKGYKGFKDGTSKEFSGVNLISDKEFSLTIAAEYIPYFHELPAVASTPTKLSFWTDETVEIKDDGNGAYFSDNFTAKNFKDRFNEARNEVGNFPATGAYKLKSYDKSNRTAVLEVNENFPGDYTGQKPKIKTIVYKKITQENALNELLIGGVDILHQVTNGDDITTGLDLVKKGGFDFVKYPRSGYGKVMFQTDFGPTKDVEVRQAIAHLIDRDDFAKSFTGGFATVVNGPYGESMWFYQETKSELNEKLNQYSYSLEEAKNLLIKAGWILDKNGNEYKEGIRYKREKNGKLIPLIIEWASPEQNKFADLLAVKLQQNKDIQEVGMEIKQTVMSFDELLLYMYRDGSVDKKYEVPKFGMYNLASNYKPIYDLTKDYTTDCEMVKAGYNNNFLADKDLENAAKDMVKLNPKDKEEYKANFVKFITKWNELLPDIPLYSNIYHDFFNEKLKNYNVNDLISISDALLYAYLEEK